MSIGIGTILFLVSFGYGLQRTLLERITTPESLLTMDVTGSKDNSQSLDQGLADKIMKIKGVDNVSPSFQLSAQAHIGGVNTEVLAYAVDNNYLKFGGIKILKGGFSKDNQAGVLISAAIPQVLNKNIEELVGQEISFTFLKKEEQQKNASSPGEEKTEKIKSGKYKIAGEADGTDTVVYINKDSLKDLQINKFSQIKVKAKNNNDLVAVRKQLEDSGLIVASVSDTVRELNKVFTVINILLMLFGIVALVVSAIGMFNTMTISLLERTEEIGIMKSIGASDLNISMIFIIESFIMGLLGGLGGVVIGLLGSQICNFLINFIATHFGGQKANLFYSPLWFILVIIVFSGFVGMVTGFGPSRRASKIDPLEALRYK